MRDLRGLVKKAIKTKKIEQNKIVLDGVLDEEEWRLVSPATNFIQRDPNEGVPSTEKTEVYVIYDKENLYIGAMLYDSDPGGILAYQKRRDQSLRTDDRFMWILDTFLDGRTGYFFEVNPAGLLGDGLITGSGSRWGTNKDWNGIWDARVIVTEQGWSVEVAIPFRTLNFNPTLDTWGINFQRTVRRKNEDAKWSGYERNKQLTTPIHAGHLKGLKDLTQGRGIELKPYISMNNKAMPSEESDVNTSSSDLGVDLSMNITSGLKGSLTYNTDFAQAEVDKQQVNLDRFNLFYPEKRSFFLENAGQFSVGSPGEIDLFFSRKIGISDNGSVVPILGGGRLSGKIGSTNIGVLSMVTDDVENVVSKNNYSVARVNHNFKNSRSSIGLAYISRDGIENNKTGAMDDYNRVYALDGVWGIGKKAKVSGFMSKSSTPFINSNDHAFKFSANYDWNSWNIYAQYSEVGEGFNPEVGYLERSSFKKPSYLIFKTIRVGEDRKLLEYRPHISGRYYFDTKGNIVTTYTHIDTHWAWKSGLEIHTGYNVRKEWVSEDFFISNLRVNSGEYNNSEVQLVFMTNKNQKLSFNNRSYICCVL